MSVRDHYITLSLRYHQVLQNKNRVKFYLWIQSDKYPKIEIFIVNTKLITPVSDEGFSLARISSSYFDICA